MDTMIETNTDTQSDRPTRDARGRFLTVPPGAAPPITSDTARDMIRMREEKRRRLYCTGAQRAVQNKKLIEEFGDDAHLVERAFTLQQIATAPDAGKAAVLADIQLQKSQGYDVRVEENNPSPADAATALAAGAAAAVLKFLNDVTAQQRQPADVIDIRSENSEDEEL